MFTAHCFHSGMRQIGLKLMDRENTNMGLCLCFPNHINMITS